MPSDTVIVAGIGLIGVPLASWVTWLLSRKQRKVDVNVSLGAVYKSLVDAAGENVETSQGLLQNVLTQLAETRTQLAKTKIEMASLHAQNAELISKNAALTQEIADLRTELHEMRNNQSTDTTEA